MTEPSPPSLSKLVPRLMGLLHRKVTGDTLAIMHEAGLTLPQMVALHALHHRGPSSINGLAETLNLSTSATSHMVERLVERELVWRREDPEDRRQKRVELAPAGAELLSRLGHAREEELERIQRELDPEVRAAVAQLLEQTIQQLQKSL